MRVGGDRDEARTGGGDDGKQAREDRTLYDRLGGPAGVAELVNDLTERIINDPRVNFERQNLKRPLLGKKYQPWHSTPENVERFKKHMIEFITLAAGGPAQYGGREMGPLHRGMQITNSEFDAFVGDLKTTMDRLGYARRETRDLLAIIETTRKQIVEKE
jgi:hemoglobin